MAEITIRISDKGLRIATTTIFGTIAFWLLAYLYALGVFIPIYRLSVYVPELEGLSVGSHVLLDGVPVGAVDTVKIAEVSTNEQRRVELVLRIRKRYLNDIPTDSVATVATQGLLGPPTINIQRGISGAAIRAGDEIRFGETPRLDFANLLTKIADCDARQNQSPQGKANSR
jgi:ABC-type transporter Mla subunit MlaD